MLTPKVTELSRVSYHRRQVELVRASLLSGVVVREERVPRDGGQTR
jgi:hypothetical protein